MTVSNICILGTIAVYLVGMLIIGFRCARKNESSADFYLGGRKLGPLVTAMSAEASDMSSYLLMGLPGLAYPIIFNNVVFPLPLLPVITVNVFS